ncbi:MAG: hypothetical protein V2I67_15305 [Thermoanaerobaculales bacterium]|jgi:hypothetical protein|nr:hypothetical protein [Thermoanaerobaculales bacterium]
MDHRATIAILAAATLVAAFANPVGAESPSTEPYIDEGRIIRPGFERSAGPAANKIYASSENNFIIRWLSPSRGVNGTLDDDLIGENEVIPSCAGSPIGGSSGSPYAYTSASAISDGRVYLNNYDAPSDNMNVVQYFLTQIESATAREVVMLVGADDGIRVWLNGDEVLRQEAPAAYAEGAHQVPVVLQEGWNLILVKVYYPQLGPRDDPDHATKYWSMRFATAGDLSPVLDVYQSVDGWCAPEDSRYAWTWAPGAADAAGARGSQWQSELQITNPYYHNLHLTLLYYSNRNTSGSPDAERTLRLRPFETVMYPNVVRELTGMADTGSGMLALSGIYYSDVTDRVAARLVTSNVGGADGGAFGTPMPFDDRYGGSTCCSQQLYGLKNGPDHRTNLLVMPGPFVPDDVELVVNLWDPESDRTASGQFTGRGSFQINDIFNSVGMGGVETSTAVAHVVYSTTDNRASLRILASVNDNVTSDPTVITRAPYGVPTPFQ